MREARQGSRRPRFPAAARRTRQADLRKHFEGSVAGLVETADHADQRKPPEHGRPARAPVPDEADRKVLLRRRRGYCAGLRAAVGLTSVSSKPVPTIRAPKRGFFSPLFCDVIVRRVVPRFAPPPFLGAAR